jgi:hypothetical protein
MGGQGRQVGALVSRLGDRSTDFRLCGITGLLLSTERIRRRPWSRTSAPARSERVGQTRFLLLAHSADARRLALCVRWASGSFSQTLVHDLKHADIKAQVKEMIATGAGRESERRRPRTNRRSRHCARRAAEPPHSDQAQGRVDRRARAQALPARRARARGRAPPQPGSVLEQADRAGQRVLDLEARVREVEASLDERDREILGLRDSLRATIGERNTGP